MKIKILCVSDLHLEKLKYEQAIIELDLLIENINKINPDIIAICGDIFDNLLFVNSKYFRLIQKFMLYLYEKQNILKIIIHGTLSHEHYQIMSFINFSGKKFKIYTEKSILDYQGMKFLILPEEYYHDKKEYYKGYLYETKNKYDFVFGHGNLDFISITNHISKVKKQLLVFNNEDFKNIVYAKVVFGHYHTRSNSKNMMYLGSYSRFAFGEEEAKGFTVFEYDKIKRKIVKEIFYENKLANKYDSIYYKILLEQDNFKDYLKKILNNVYKLRIFIDEDIDKILYHDLISFTKSHYNCNIKRIKKSDIKKEISTNNKMYFHENKHFIDLTFENLKKSDGISRSDLIDFSKKE